MLLRILYIIDGTVKWYNYLKNILKCLTKLEYIYPTIQQFYSLQEKWMCMFPKTRVQMFTEALFINETLETVQVSIYRIVNKLECSCNEILHSKKQWTTIDTDNSMNKFPKHYTVKEVLYRSTYSMIINMKT